jgi:hypothetical protein
LLGLIAPNNTEQHDDASVEVTTEHREETHGSDGTEGKSSVLKYHEYDALDIDTQHQGAQQNDRTPPEETNNGNEAEDDENIPSKSQKNDGARKLNMYQMLMCPMSTIQTVSF